MKAYLLAAILFLSSAAACAHPPCWPKQVGSTGSYYKAGETETTRWIGWTCTARGVKTVYGAVALKDYKIIHPASTATTSLTLRAYWAANIGPINNSLLPGWIAMNTELQP